MIVKLQKQQQFLNFFNKILQLKIGFLMGCIKVFKVTYFEIFKIFSFMNKDYFKPIPRPKDLIKQASDSFNQPINQQIQRLKSDYIIANLLMLQKLLQSQKSCKALSEQQKAPIFRYILQQEFKLRTFLHSRSTTALRILNLVQSRIKSLRIDWLEVYQAFRQQERQLAMSKSSILQQFIKIIRPFFDPNNAMDVVKKFACGENLNQQNIYTYIQLFSYICSDTSQQIFKQYLQWIFQSYKKKNIQANTFFLMFINSINKRKQTEVQQVFYKQFNTIVLTAMMNPTIKEMQNDSRFTKNNAEIIYFLVGKNNPLSLQLLDRVFTIINKNIFPFEQSTRALIFFNNLLRWFWKRIQSEKHTRKKLEKLFEKQGKTISQKEKQQEQQQQDQKNLEEEQEKQQANQWNLAKELLSIQEDEGENDDDSIKKQRYERILKRQITQDIIQLLRKHIEIMFQNAYFVNSKQTVSQLLRYIFMLFPDFCQKSLELIDKANNIRYINQQALIFNIKVTVQYIFTKGKQVFAVKNIVRILEKIYETGNIANVWGIYELIYSKIPLLDGKDMIQVSKQEKNKFLNKFGQSHDIFYQAYSENVFQAYKKLLRQGQFFDEATSKTHGQALSDLLYNCYPNFKNRLINQAIEVIKQSNNQFAFIQLDIYNKPLPKRMQEILQSNLKSIKHSQASKMILRQQIIVSALFHSKSLKQIQPYIRSFAKNNRFSLIHDYMRAKTTIDIQIDPLKSSLDFFETDPKLKLKDAILVEQRQASLKQFHAFFDRLVKQLKQLLEEPDMKGQSKQSIIYKLYKTQENTKNADKRKSIYELLRIITIMNRNFEQYIYAYDNQTAKLVDPQIPPPDILGNQFLQIIYKIVYNSQMLEDARISGVLTQLICSPTNKYFEKIKNEKQVQKRAQSQNPHRQAPENRNIKFFIYTLISQIKVCHAAIMFNKKKNDSKIDKIKDILILLLVAPQNQKVGQIISALILQNKINLFNQQIVQLFRLSNKLQSYLYQNRLTEIFQILKNNGGVFSPNQTANLVEYNLSLSIHFDKKLRDASLKSLTHLMKFTEEVDVHDSQSTIKLELQKCITKQKLQIIWVYSIYLLIYQKDKTSWQGVQFIQDVQRDFNVSKIQKHPYPPSNLRQRVQKHLQNLQNLIINGSTVMRRIAMLIYANFHRKYRKQYNTFKEESVSNLQYKEKSIEDFLKTGYIYPQHSEINIKDRSGKRKQPYSVLELKQAPDFPTQTYKFLIDFPQKAEYFLKAFHAGMAETLDQAISQRINLKAVDLSDAIFGLMEQTYKFFKLRKFEQSMLSEPRFFKYLFYQDSTNGYQFFQNSKAFVSNCLTNLQRLDNQKMLFFYTSNLLTCYRNRFHIVGQHKGIEQFIQKVTQKFVQDSSGMVYKNFIKVVFSGVQDLRPIQFINKLCEKMIESRTKVSRYGQILLQIKPNDRAKHMQILRILLDEKIELENSFLLKLINQYVQISQRMPINKKHASQTKILNIQKLQKEEQIYKISDNTYIIARKEFQQYILEKINQFITSETMQLTKLAYNIVNYVLKSLFKTIKTKQSINITAVIMRTGFKLINKKGQYQLDHKIFQETLKEVFNQPLSQEYFESFINVVIDEMQPTKKCIQIVQMISQRSFNFLLLDQSIYENFIMKVLKTQQNLIIFKQTLSILTNLLEYRSIDIEKMKLQKSEKALMYQAYLLGNMKLEKQKVDFIMKVWDKDKLKIWAKQFVVMRGKKEFLDNQQQSKIWGQIKNVSNPYFYHA